MMILHSLWTESDREDDVDALCELLHEWRNQGNSIKFLAMPTLCSLMRIPACAHRLQMISDEIPEKTEDEWLRWLMGAGQRLPPSERESWATWFLMYCKEICETIVPPLLVVNATDDEEE